MEVPRRNDSGGGVISNRVIHRMEGVKIRPLFRGGGDLEKCRGESTLIIGGTVLPTPSGREERYNGKGTPKRGNRKLVTNQRRSVGKGKKERSLYNEDKPNEPLFVRTLLPGRLTEKRRASWGKECFYQPQYREGMN